VLEPWHGDRVAESSGGEAVVLWDIVGADMRQHRMPVLGAQPADDDGLDRVDAPAELSLVVVIAKIGRAVELGAGKVAPESVAREAAVRVCTGRRRLDITPPGIEATLLLGALPISR
jgi:hypothetical protein